MIEIPIILSEDGSMSEEALRNAISLVKAIGESPENCIFVPSEPEKESFVTTDREIKADDAIEFFQKTQKNLQSGNKINESRFWCKIRSEKGRFVLLTQDGDRVSGVRDISVSQQMKRPAIATVNMFVEVE